MNDEPAKRAQVHTVRRHMVLKGAFVALSVVAIGLVGSWLPAGWAQPVASGLILALLLLVLIRMDRTTPDQLSRVLGAMWFTLAASALAAVAMAALTDQFATRPVVFAAAAGAAMSVWLVAGWRVGRP